MKHGPVFGTRGRIQASSVYVSKRTLAVRTELLQVLLEVLVFGGVRELLVVVDGPWRLEPVLVAAHTSREIELGDLWWCMVWFGVVNMVWYCEYGMVWYGMVLYCAVLNYTMLY